MIDQEKFQRVFPSHRNLPVLPVIFYELLKIMEEENFSSRKAAELISRDQSLAARVLKLANSPLYGGQQEKNDIITAINFLGMERVKDLLLQIFLVKLFPEMRAEFPEFRIEIFWKHSLATAYFASLIQEKLKLANVKNGYLCGLLHDIGLLALFSYQPEMFVAVLREMKASGCSTVEAEKVLFDFNHCEIGFYLATSWHFSHELQDAILFHHSPLESPSNHVLLTYYANIFAKIAGFALPYDEKVYELLQDPLWKRFVSNSGDFDLERFTFELFDQAPKIVETVRVMLEMAQ